MKYLTICLSLLFAFNSNAQEQPGFQNVLNLQDKLFGAIDKKAREIEEGIDRKANKFLSKLERREEKLKRKIARKDSVLARQIFGNVKEHYATIKSDTSKNFFLNDPSADSLYRGLQFIQSTNKVNDPRVQQAIDRLRQAQSKLSLSNNIRERLSERQKQMRQHFQKLGLVKEYKRLKRDAYYYGAQIRECKDLLNNPSRLEQKALQVLSKIPAFQEFMKNNSRLSDLLPGSLTANSLTNISSVQSIGGLQSRASLQQVTQNRLLPAGPNAVQLVSQQISSSIASFNPLKDKISLNGGSSLDDLPDFKPNSQRTKTFRDRLEYGLNIQSQKARYYFPVTSDIAFTLGYKLNDKSIVGIGASYKLGWGKDWGNIKISHQGLGLRSFIDWKLKGKIYLSGGYEQNYRSLFNKLSELKNFDAWTPSGMIGLTKKFQLKKKLKGQVGIHHDFLYKQNIPQSEPIVFRFGYTF